MTGALFYAGHARARCPNVNEASEVWRKSCGLTAWPRRAGDVAKHGAGLPHDFPQNGLLASAIDISASLRHRRPRPPTSRPSRRRGDRTDGARTDRWKDACMGISGREGGREGAPFPNRESVNRTLMRRVIPRADQDRIVFEGWRGTTCERGVCREGGSMRNWAAAAGRHRLSGGPSGLV